MKAESLVKKAQAQIAEANLQKARLNLSYTNIKAPISGLTTRPYIDDGNLVGASETTLLTEIVNNEKIYFYFDLSERDYLELRRMFPDARPEKGRQRIKVHAQLADEKGFPHLGRIDFSEPKLDPSTGTLTARAIFDNKDRIMVAGMFGRIRIPIRRREAALVPEIAIGTSQAGRYLLVVGEKNIVEQRLVDLGAQKGTLRVIEKGVNRDDLIVVNAIQRARPGAPVNPQMTRIKDETVAEPEGKQEKEHERERGQKESDAPAQNQPAKKEAE
jgi:membrane fusion protein (multidrug efflux system)